MNKVEEMITEMSSHLQDDSTFLSDLERNLDFVEQAKQRNERLEAEAKRRTLRTILFGIIIASVIVIMYVSLRNSAMYSVFYAVAAACLSSVAILVYNY